MLHPHRPGPAGLYDPAFEHDACGVGFVADMDGRRRHDVLAMGLAAIANLSHRGAVASDGRSSDGTGVLTQLPHALLVQALPMGLAPLAIGELAAGMVFLPTDPDARRAAEAIAETALGQHGLSALMWRDVPVEPAVLGAKARASMPAIRQVLVARPGTLDAAAFERRLLVARKGMERDAAAAGLGDFYVCSLSARTIVYKGLVMADELADFYPDLSDPAFETAICVFHQRYSTNTFPTWPLAQPFRVVGHNGEINTISGNRHWMGAREAELTGGGWDAAELAALRPVIEPGGSDSCSLDNTLELLSRSGRTLVHALMMLMPEALGPDADPELRGFYDYHACLMEPWDGPAAVAFTDGRLAGARLDRNGLRPARYVLTDDRLVVLGSEAGMLDLPAARVIEKGKLGPGQSLIIDTGEGRLYRHAELGAEAARHRPYRDWVEAETIRVPAARAAGPIDPAGLHARQLAFGLTAEDVEKLLVPMATLAKEPVGSMGDDTPLAALSQQPRSLYHYFAQRFAQVTNPPIDPLREKLVMRLDTWLGARRSLLEATPAHARLVRLASPVLTPGELAALEALASPCLAVLPATWAASAGEAGLEARLQALGTEAVTAVRAGAGVLVLSDRWVSPERVALPMPLALGAVRQALLAAGLAMRASIVCEAGDVFDDHGAAVLLGFGAAAVCPHVAVETLEALASSGQVGACGPEQAVANFQAAMETGLRKIMAKMGISAITSYQGAQLFEILGLSDAVAARYFPGTPSRLGGRDLTAIARQALAAHAVAYPETAGKLPDVGRYRYRVGGEYHANGPEVFKAIQKLAKSGVPEDIAALAAVVGGRPPVSVRDLLRFKPGASPVPLAEVEPAEAIVARFVASAMSLGSLSREAHECIAIAMNRLGAKSNSGEGGEDPARFRPRPDGDSANSTIKQVASGRFGVTPAYLMSGEELEIKMAQGAKPGEGGQLPAAKVNSEIARLRHATPGTSLISPPPHHDIYSIEDLAQLIYDLRAINPRARVAVKLVSVAGVGTIAAGVAKAHADLIHISGHDGGTGASPLGSIKHAGVPWELGLAEAQQVLVMNDLRGRVRLRADGGLKTGRDVIVAALLGAEEYAFGTALLIAAGCVMIRQCHNNTCPTGIATQDPKLRARFKGTPENVVN
ncbi:MAG: glutamate synthase large subunit, partial [Candidatus Sericytochromatia bacterium]